MEKPLALAERDIEKALRSTRTGDVDDVEDLDCACGGQPTTSAGESKDVQQGRVSIGPNVLTVKVSTRAAKKQRPRNSRFANDLSVPKGMYLSVMGSYASISPSRMTLSLVSLARSAISGRGRTRRCRGRALRRGRRQRTAPWGRILPVEVRVVVRFSTAERRISFPPLVPATTHSPRPVVIRVPNLMKLDPLPIKLLLDDELVLGVAIRILLLLRRHGLVRVVGLAKLGHALGDPGEVALVARAEHRAERVAGTNDAVLREGLSVRLASTEKERTEVRTCFGRR